MLEVKNITKYYGDFLAVDNLSFEINEGEIFGLLGVNGAGKTTTFRIIMGLLEQTEGSVRLNDKKIDYSVTDDIGFLTEERSLLPGKTVLEQALFYGALKNLSKEEIENRLDEYLKKFKIEQYKNKKIKELSKGNCQKVQFIMSILHKPKLLILDEPFSGLDPINVEMFKEEILRLKKDKTIIILSSHQMQHIEYFCDSLVILVKGKTVLEGKLKKIKEDYRRKNIKIIADITKEKLEKIKGVIAVDKTPEEFIVTIENNDYIDEVFKEVSKSKSITKFVVEEPSLNEIFVSIVGEAYEK